jgi:dTDP-4-amino-4,6-dideoxygalactose transaminase
MIQLFNIPDYIIDTSKFTHALHGKNVTEFENKFADYVGAKYAVAVNSATTAIFLIFKNQGVIVNVPSMIPPVVLNALITSGNAINFTDDVNWIGGSYTLHNFKEYKVIDSAQKVERNQFKNDAKDEDLMLFSFYPTKPVGSSDGGIIVSNDEDKIKHLRTLAYNGMSQEGNNWERKIILPGYKMYMNSIQAHLANKNLDLLDEKQTRISEIRDIYNKELGYNNTSKHLYRINVTDRDNFLTHMKSNGITCGIHYDAMHLHDVYSLWDIFDCGESEKVSKECVSIPLHEKLTDNEIKHIIKTINLNI